MYLLLAEASAASWDGLRWSLYVLIIATVLVWYYSRIRYRNIITVEFSRITRVITNKIYQGKPAIYGPGTYALSAGEKVLEFVDTNVRNRPIEGKPMEERFRAGSDQVEFKLVYEYQVWYIRSAEPENEAAAAKDEVLSDNVLRAYEHFDKEPERFRAVQQIISQQIETAGRIFSPATLSDADKHPCDIRVVLTGNAGDRNRKIAGIVWVKDDLPHPLPLLPPADNLGAVIRIDSERALFDFMRDFIKDRTNALIGEWGLEIPSFSVHDIPYVRADLQARAEKMYEAQLLEQAVNELLLSGQAATPQEAMLIALGQDDQYGRLVIHQRWQELIQNNPDLIETIIRAVRN